MWLFALARPAGARRLPSLLAPALVMCAALAAPAHADEACTLKKTIKVRIGGAFQTIAAGTAITVKARRSDWTEVTTPSGDGKAATVPLEAACTLSPRPPDGEPPLAPITPEKPTKPPKAEKPPKPPKAEKPPPKPPEPKPPKPEKPKAEKPTKPEKPTTTTTTTTPPARVGLDAVPPPPAPESPTSTAPPATSGSTTPETTTTTASTTPEPTTPVRHDMTRGARLWLGGLDNPTRGRALTVVNLALRDEAQKHTGVSVVDGAAPAGCVDDACVAAALAAAGVDVALNVRVVDDGAAVLVRRVDRGGFVTVARQPVVAGDDRTLLAAVGPAVDSVLADAPVAAGQTSGASAFRYAQLDPPPVAPWVPLSVGGAAVVAGAVALGATGVNVAAFNAGAELIAAGTSAAPADGAAIAAERATVQTTFPIAVGAAAVAVVLGGTAGVLATFTDWAGAHDLESAE